ncbi:hypothetical protein CEXT_469321 [Caerostris extrusa]|uniref:Uncharacterized protein n=1 Tax=Caerostris extrusa TaxID=172846 RepID=A0AAV4NHS8_CAEEX|nr:hypothetical protein CEXT_469321 [Caerostris extrusa]
MFRRCHGQVIVFYRFNGPIRRWDGFEAPVSESGTICFKLVLQQGLALIGTCAFGLSFRRSRGDQRTCVHLPPSGVVGMERLELLLEELQRRSVLPDPEVREWKSGCEGETTKYKICNMQCSLYRCMIPVRASSPCIHIIPSSLEASRWTEYGGVLEKLRILAVRNSCLVTVNRVSSSLDYGVLT